MRPTAQTHSRLTTTVEHQQDACPLMVMKTARLTDGIFEVSGLCHFPDLSGSVREHESPNGHHCQFDKLNELEDDQETSQPDHQHMPDIRSI